MVYTFACSNDVCIECFLSPSSATSSHEPHNDNDKKEPGQVILNVEVLCPGSTVMQVTDELFVLLPSVLVGNGVLV